MTWKELLEQCPARAAKGARWLDGVKPDWWTLIDLETLDPGSSCRCVAGQTFEEEAEVAEQDSVYKDSGYRFDGYDYIAFTINAGWGTTLEWRAAHGFAGSSHSVPDLEEAPDEGAFDIEMDALKQAWVSEVNARRQNSPATSEQSITNTPEIA